MNIMEVFDIYCIISERLIFCLATYDDVFEKDMKTVLRDLIFKVTDNFK